MGQHNTCRHIEREREREREDRMILLETANKILEEALKTAFAAEKPERIKMTIADFDGVLFKVYNPDRNVEKINIGISLGCYAQLKQHGAEDVLRRENGMDAMLSIDVTSLPANKDELAHKIALFKRNCFAGAYEKFFALQAKGGDKETAQIDYRDDESVFIQAQEDRVTVTFTTLFRDADDVTIGKVFLQEFVDARRQQQQAPQVLYYYKEPPAELNGFNCKTGNDVGYVTYVLFPRHFDDRKRETTIDLTMTSRNYLHYHIKCAKAYLHSRMRLRVALLLKILNRARPEQLNKEKKTASGRAFVWRV